MTGDSGGAGSGVGVGVGIGVGSGASGVVVHPLIHTINRHRLRRKERVVFMMLYIYYILYKYAGMQEEQYL